MPFFSKRLVWTALVGIFLISSSYAAEISARLGSQDRTTTAKHRGLVKATELIKTRTDGRVDIKIFHSSQLGNAREMVEAVQLGALDIVITPSAFLGGFNQAVSIFDIPYIFPTDEEVSRKLREGPFGKAVLATFKARGFEPMALWSGGRKVLSSNKPLNSVSDIAGQRFRVMNSKILMEQFSALKASAIALPFGELYTSLQNGVIDAQENPADTIEKMKFFEVQKNVLVTNHGAIVEVILASPAFWKRLSKKDQGIVRAAFSEVAGEVAAGKQADAVQSLKNIANAGTNVQMASEAERKKLRDMAYPAARDVYLKLADKQGSKLISLYEKELKAATK